MPTTGRSTKSKVGLNFNRGEGNLYASDRMAQFLGNGILLATSRRSGYQAYFGDDEMLFFDDVAELAGQDRVGHLGRTTAGALWLSGRAPKRLA